MAEKVIIIGSGPAGCTAAIYTARANLQPLHIEGFMAGGTAGGQLMTTGLVENFPGFPKGIDGQELMMRIREQVVEAGARVVADDVAAVDLSKRPFVVTTVNGERFETHALIVATGATAKRLDMESEKRLFTKGISACAVCDGGLPMFRNKPLAVLGGGDTAIEEAMHLTHFGSLVYLIHRRDTFRASKVMRQRALTNPKIKVLWNKVVDEFLGEKLLSGLKLKDTMTGEISTLDVAGCFEAIGHQPNVGFLNGQVELNSLGYIKTEAGTTITSIEGVFAAGDVQDAKYRQAVAAAGSGCMAALEAERWLGDMA